MKIHRLITCMCLIILTSLSISCEKEDDVPRKTNNTIVSISVQCEYKNQAENGNKEYKGRFGDDGKYIYFDIPSASKKLVDIKKLVVVASVLPDAVITPGLSGLKDLSEPFRITVVAGDKSLKTYYLLARYI